jgi:hypothetical protein
VQVSAFKWSGVTQGPRSGMVSTVRQTILSLETNIPAAFMHTNWPLLRSGSILVVINTVPSVVDRQTFPIFLFCSLNYFKRKKVFVTNVGNQSVPVPNNLNLLKENIV